MTVNIAIVIIICLSPVTQSDPFCPWKGKGAFYCATNGKTYNSYCEMKRALFNDANLKIAHRGRCNSSDDNDDTANENVSNESALDDKENGDLDPSSSSSESAEYSKPIQRPIPPNNPRQPKPPRRPKPPNNPPNRRPSNTSNPDKPKHETYTYIDLQNDAANDNYINIKESEKERKPKIGIENNAHNKNKIDVVAVLLAFASQSHSTFLCPFSLFDKFMYCGTDGITYSSLCQITQAIFRNPLIQVFHKGPCDGYHSVPETFDDFNDKPLRPNPYRAPTKTWNYKKLPYIIETPRKPTQTIKLTPMIPEYDSLENDSIYAPEFVRYEKKRPKKKGGSRYIYLNKQYYQ